MEILTIVAELSPTASFPIFIFVSPYTTELLPPPYIFPLIVPLIIFILVVAFAVAEPTLELLPFPPP